MHLHSDDNDNNTILTVIFVQNNNYTPENDRVDIRWRLDESILMRFEAFLLNFVGQCEK
jgi:low affinity Fe/Cu permease